LAKEKYVSFALDDHLEGLEIEKVKVILKDKPKT
jgi:hypothetical protein